MQSTTIKIQGLGPLLMHNGQLANPMNEHAIRLSELIKKAKTAKTEAAWTAAYRAEFDGGLYLDEKVEPCLTGETLEGMIQEGAKKTKQGKQAKAAIIIDGNFPLFYKGPRDADSLWEAKFFKTVGVKIGPNRVMRTRAMFTGWSCAFQVHFNESIVNKKDIANFVKAAGAEVGLCDWRPRYGRFEVIS